MKRSLRGIALEWARMETAIDRLSPEDSEVAYANRSKARVMFYLGAMALCELVDACSDGDDFVALMAGVRQELETFRIEVQDKAEEGPAGKAPAPRRAKAPATTAGGDHGKRYRHAHRHIDPDPQRRS